MLSCPTNNHNVLEADPSPIYTSCQTSLAPAFSLLRDTEQKIPQSCAQISDSHELGVTTEFGGNWLCSRR